MAEVLVYWFGSIATLVAAVWVHDVRWQAQEIVEGRLDPEDVQVIGAARWLASRRGIES